MHTITSLTMYPIMILLITLTTTTLAVIPSSQQKSIPTTNKGFVARLIYRTSPMSPHYDPNLSVDDIVAENHRISAARIKYRMRVRTTAMEKIKPKLKITNPVVSKDFVMLYHIGTPPVEALGVPDTGSDLIWLQCSPCYKCYPQTTSLFNPHKSSTFEMIPCMSSDCHLPYGRCADDNLICSFEQKYIIGPTAHGMLAKEEFHLGYIEDDDILVVEDVIFGCGTFNTHPEEIGHSGMVGLGNSSISLLGQIGGPRKFSYCHTSGYSSGLIRFGYRAKLLGEGKTPLVPNPFNSYHLILEGINVANVMVNISSDVFKMRDDIDWETGVIIDSGCSVTELIPVAFDAVTNTVKQLLAEYISITKANWEVCYGPQDYGPMPYDILPDMTFKFKDMPLRIPRENLWIWDQKREYVCLAISRFSNSSFSIIGMRQQDSFNVAYDLEENQLWMSYENHCADK